MKCKVKPAKANDRGRNLTTHAHQVIYCDITNKLQGCDLMESQILSNMSQETHNMRYSKTVPRDISLGPLPTYESYYAGAKFSGSPSPTDLPKPPSHWTKTPFIMSSGGVYPTLHARADKQLQLSSQFKMLINSSA